MAKKIEKKSKLKAALPAKQLAIYGDPYVMADGRVIQQEHLMDEDRPEHGNAKKYRPTRKRSIRDLPASPAILKGVAVVFSYTVLGLSDRDIAESLGITVSDVRAVRQHTAYDEVFSIISNEFISARSSMLTSRIAAYADDALTTVADVMVNGKKENDRLRAGIDMLDRAGVRPKDTEKRASAEQNELRITIVKGDAEVNLNGIKI